MEQWINVVSYYYLCCLALERLVFDFENAPGPSADEFVRTENEANAKEIKIKNGSRR